MRILLAEDETVMAMAIQTRLKNEGFDVMRAADGREAMQLLRVRFARYGNYRYFNALYIGPGTNCRYSGEETPLR